MLGATVSAVEAPGGADAPLLVRSRDGLERRARRVVVTASVGVLQSGLLAFSPPLPAAMRAALGGLRMARYAKLFVEWEERWWQPGGAASPSLLGALHTLLVSEPNPNPNP